MNIKEFNGLDSFNRKSNGEEMTHEEKFTNVINAIGLGVCSLYLPVDIDVIKKALKDDEHLNNIPVIKWDNMHPFFKKEFIRIGINSVSLSDTVCTLKQTARILARKGETK